MRSLFWSVMLVIGLLAIVMPVNAETLKVTIHNPNDYDLTDYQVRVDLSGYLDSVGYLRVTDENGNDLKFCYEQANGECGANPSSVIWVKVPKIPANGDTVIYVEKSNKNHAVNGDQVFDFYDDFNNRMLDSSKWTIIQQDAGDIFVKDSFLNIIAYGGADWWTEIRNSPIIIANKKFVKPYEVDTKLKIIQRPEDDFWAVFTIFHDMDNALHFDIGSWDGTPSNNEISWEGIIDGEGFARKETYISTNFNVENKWWLIKAIVKQSQTEGYIICLDNNWITTHIYYYSFSQIGFAGKNWGKYNSNLKFVVDWIRVRKYTDIEPKITVQSLIPKPKLTLMIQTDTELKEGETRYSKLIVKNEGTAPAQNVVITLFSQGLNI